MPSNNKVIIAAAGSGKTTCLIKQAMENHKKRICIITYTIDNLNEITNAFCRANGSVPDNVTIVSWFSFLLNECVRPYQNVLYDDKRIENICFVNGVSAKFVSKSDITKYYLHDGREIYTDKISEFSCLCNEQSNGAVINRLANLYDSLYIDEVQDLAGFDFDLLEVLFDSQIEIVTVGDNRQHTFATNNSRKYKKFKGSNIIDLFKLWEGQNKCQIEYMRDCFRSNQMICELADSLYPEMPKTISKNDGKTGHDGVFVISENDLEDYILKNDPIILRYDRKTKIDGFGALNFGLSKGLTFDRVLILPNGPIKKFLKTGDIKHVEKSRAKFYVALTRARYSVAFLYNGKISERLTFK